MYNEATGTEVEDRIEEETVSHSGDFLNSITGDGTDCMEEGLTNEGYKGSAENKGSIEETMFNYFVDIVIALTWTGTDQGGEDPANDDYAKVKESTNDETFQGKVIY